MLSASFAVRDVDLRFAKSDDSTVNVYATRMHILPADGSKDTLLGRLTLAKNGKGRVLGIAWDPHLDPKFRELIWSNSVPNPVRGRRGSVRTRRR
jgi:hypothetical protein